MKTTQEKIAIMQAFVDGKPLQIRGKDYPEWEDWCQHTHKTPSFDWGRCDYRIKEDVELKAWNMYPGAHVKRLESLDSSTHRAWMRAIIDAVKRGDIT